MHAGWPTACSRKAAHAPTKIEELTCSFLFFLFIPTVIVVIIAWFAILFTGRYPRSLFDFVEGVIAWGNRVTAYAFLMATDRYPPFQLSGDAEAAAR